jgi:hypothetical protein
MNADPEANDAQIQSFIEQLYESENLTDYLTDDDARLLLAWGEQELKSLAGGNPAQRDLENAAGQLRRILRSINRTVGQRAEISDTKMVRRLLRLVENSKELATRKSMTKTG